MQDDPSTNGWVKLHHPQDPQVTIPLDLNMLVTPNQATTLLQSVTNLLNAGFSVFARGLQDGENYEQVGWPTIFPSALAGWRYGAFAPHISGRM